MYRREVWLCTDQVDLTGRPANVTTYIGWLISGWKTRGSILARRLLNCRGVPTCQQGGRPAFCGRMCFVWPFPQLQWIIREVKVDCVTLRVCCSFLRLMFQVAFGNGGVLLAGAWGLNILTSRKVLSNWSPQNTFTVMSSLAASTFWINDQKFKFAITGKITLFPDHWPLQVRLLYIWQSNTLGFFG